MTLRQLPDSQICYYSSNSVILILTVRVPLPTSLPKSCKVKVHCWAPNRVGERRMGVTEWSSLVVRMISIDIYQFSIYFMAPSQFCRCKFDRRLPFLGSSSLFQIVPNRRWAEFTNVTVNVSLNTSILLLDLERKTYINSVGGLALSMVHDSYKTWYRWDTVGIADANITRRTLYYITKRTELRVTTDR